ncbi:3-keto-disaccharide hydrolase [Engelhardtia mirabilis]|uniref:3-keto-alpha-glucoside-1,2-lyase/3-keto-2-hydroxy-glucal hydratase domain-containing protein n=1 Tax=Engelhardtia mirabilis TaxID=2528011 RepID=A0A518BNK7_9BACT|nr:hypothetical protein Pla133_36630 [Planctomycetes bacterium Pla133]QDV02889.1 hypothetical protein Pla86_36610 [Planctomycetes bacterium Pla86]
MRRAQPVLQVLFLGGLMALSSCAADRGVVSASEAGEDWIALFDGASLDGWTPKLVGQPLGSDTDRTFRVRDGLLVVDYGDYEGDFAERFGHLFHELPLSHYRLRIEYRFVGEQVPGGPGWALRNSGVMLHCQDPATMGLDQSFPVSIEAQMLGGDGVHERHNGNLCTPGTHVEMGGELITRHCTDSTSHTYHGDEWVLLELEVHGSERVVHWLEGEPVLEYGGLQLDPGDADAARLLEAGAALELDHGWISIQAESHPLEVRRIELLMLPETD